MTITSGLRATLRVSAATAAVGLFIAFSGLASAQEISAEHLKQARAAIAAIGATNQFDAILPQAATALKAEMIQKDPNLEALITTTVDTEVLALVSRRGDLENEAARVYAKVFTEAELKAIGEFYATDVGKKLLSDGPLATRQLVDAANIWQAGVARDLAQKVGEKMKAAAPAEPAPAGTEEKAPEQHKG
jgi:hypothetical protein